MDHGTLHLVYPEWQGYGLGADVHAGALALAAEWFRGRDAVTIDAPVKERLAIEDGVLGLASIAPRLAVALDTIHRRAPDRILTAGGTCGAELAPIAYLNERYDGDLAVLWLDAHADLNTPASSPSGHFHGMALRALLGDGPDMLVDHLSRPLTPAQVFLVGTRDLDPAERDFIVEHEIPLFDDDAFENPWRLMRELRSRGFSHLYVHFDVDVLDPDRFSASLMRVPGGGPSLEQAGELIQQLRREFDVVGLSVLELANASADVIRAVCDEIKSDQP